MSGDSEQCPICGDVHGGFEPQTVIYLPMDCPNCGRRRLEWDGVHVICEKCRVVNWQHPSRGEPVRYASEEMVINWEEQREGGVR